MHPKIASITQIFRLPSACILCHQYHRQPFAVCDTCCSYLTPIGPACHYCAFPLPDNTFLICGGCTKAKPAFDHAIAAYLFEEPLRTLLLEFKYHEALYLSRFLTKLMLNALTNQALQTQCLIPIPLHPKRLRERGFNQAAELAKRLAKQLNIPCELNLCEKIRHTTPQASLNKTQRKQNLRNAFHCKPTKYRHITLIDDLLTTGSTANELAHTFKQQGVEQVDVWCCARAV